MELKTEIEKKASALVASGLFTSIDEVLSHGLEMLEHDAFVEENRATLQIKMEEGLQSKRLKISHEMHDQLIEDIMVEIRP